MDSFLKIFAVAAVALALFGCTQTAPVPGFELGSAFTVRENSSYFNPAEDLNISVVSFADSRCPAGVECARAKGQGISLAGIWAGEQGINLLVSSGGQGFSIYLGERTARSRPFSFSPGKSFEVSLVSVDADKKEAQIMVAKAAAS